MLSFNTIASAICACDLEDNNCVRSVVFVICQIFELQESNKKLVLLTWPVGKMSLRYYRLDLGNV